MMKKIYGLLAVFCVVTACASDPDMDDWSAEQIYNKAFEDLEATKYKKAAQEFEKVETEHPYSKWAVKSKLMSAFAYYKDEKYDDAIIATDRFLKYHPGNKDAAYALYLKGICYYDQISAADKDQGDTKKAEEAFQYLIALFPNTPYAEDARQKINLTEDYKAGQEMIVGRFYLNDGNYLSALNRFNVVLENYQTTIQIEEALYREVEIYAILGMNQYANGYYKILQQNYPNGRWTAKAAKIMQKIGVRDKVATGDVLAQVKTATKDAPSASSSWFSGWFGGSDEEETVEVAEVVPTESEKSSSWFSGWFGGSDEEKTAEVAEVVPTEAEKSSSWFSGWFGGSDEEKTSEVAKESWYSKWKEKKASEQLANNYVENEPTTSSSWFGGWFGGGDDVSETVAEAPLDTSEPRESSSWFSGWFGGGDDASETVAEAPVMSSDLQPENDFSYKGEESRVVVASKEESKSWFNWFDDNTSGN